MTCEKAECAGEKCHADGFRVAGKTSVACGLLRPQGGQFGIAVAHRWVPSDPLAVGGTGDRTHTGSTNCENELN